MWFYKFTTDPCQRGECTDTAGSRPIRIEDLGLLWRYYSVQPMREKNHACEMSKLLMLLILFLEQLINEGHAATFDFSYIDAGKLMSSFLLQICIYSVNHCCQNLFSLV